MTEHSEGMEERGRDQRVAAVILAGAAAKGPYAAGALSVIARDERFYIETVVGTSSGALNAAVFAAGLRVGRAKEAADLLCDLWENRATAWRIAAYRSRVGVVKDALKIFAGQKGRRAVRLDVAVTSLPGVLTDTGRVRYEDTYSFTSSDFTDEGRIDLIARICVASSSIPVLFPPRKVQGEGPYWDGGLVNNAPIGVALKRDDRVDHVLVVTPDAMKVEHRRFGRFSLGRLFSILIEERLSRDLDEARSFNEELRKLDQLGVLQKVRDLLNWRVVEFIEVRPQEDLRGNALQGFLSKALRQSYISTGRLNAVSAISDWQGRCEEPDVEGISRMSAPVSIGDR